MPKIVGHDERHTDIVRAIIKVVAEGDPFGATLGIITPVAGFSSGVIALCFAYKVGLLRYASGFAADRVRALARRPRARSWAAAA
jgi:hypothetical protein